MDHRCSDYRDRTRTRVVGDAERFVDQRAPECAPCSRWLADAVRSEGVLAEMPTVAAPAALRELVERELAPAAVREVASLPTVRAPSVLERLVREELADAPGQRARRFVGDLPVQAAPATLWERAFEGDRVRRRLRALRPLAALAAAVVVWLALRPAPAEDDWSFQVVRVDDPRAFDPMASALAGGLTGGATTALGSAPPPAPGPEAGG